VKNQPILTVSNYTKSFGDVIANDSICLEIESGEIHCLLGENGAGKTTFAECVFGYYQTDCGKLLFNGSEIKISSPSDAISAGIGMVHQHFVLARSMNAVENIAVGIKRKGISPGLSKIENDVKEICKLYDIELPLSTPVKNLSVSDQQWIEIIKALYLGAKLLILDEPTAVLTPQETEKLFGTILEMKQKGFSFLLITHKLKEVMSYSDRVTVLRKGRVIATVNTDDVNEDYLAEMMVGNEISLSTKRKKVAIGDCLLSVQDISAIGENTNLSLNDVSFDLYEGEILGVAGVSGNGKKELFDCLVGYQKINGGKVIFDNELISNQNPYQLITKGIACVPPDRIHQGLLMNFPIKESLMLGLHFFKPISNGFRINHSEVDKFALDQINKYQIVASSPDQITQTLSGGNLQKLILSRELSRSPKLIVAYSPTRGLDVASTKFVHEKLLTIRETGASVLLISEDLDEIYTLADRLIILYRGRIVGNSPINKIAKSDVGLLMAGCSIAK